MRSCWRRGEDDLYDLGNARRDGGHQHAARIGRAAAGCVHRDALQRSNQLAEGATAGRVLQPGATSGVLVEGADAPRRRFEGRRHPLADALHGRLDVLIGDVHRAQVDVVEGPGVVSDGPVSAPADVGEEAPDLAGTPEADEVQVGVGRVGLRGAGAGLSSCSCAAIASKMRVWAA